MGNDQDLGGEQRGTASTPDTSGIRRFFVLFMAPLGVGLIATKFGSSPWLLLAPIAFIAVALLTVPQRGFLRPEYHGRERWSVALALMLVLVYLALSSWGVTRALPVSAATVIQVLLLWGAAVLLLWRSGRPGMPVHEAAYALAWLLLAVSLLVSSVRFASDGNPVLVVVSLLVASSILLDAVSYLRFGIAAATSRGATSSVLLMVGFAAMVIYSWVNAGAPGIPFLLLIMAGLGVALLSVSRLAVPVRWVASAALFGLSFGWAYMAYRTGFTRATGIALTLASVSFVSFGMGAVLRSRRAVVGGLGLVGLSALIWAGSLVATGAYLGAAQVALLAGTVLSLAYVILSENLAVLWLPLLLGTGFALCSALDSFQQSGFSFQGLFMLLMAATMLMMTIGFLPSDRLRSRLEVWRRWWTSESEYAASESSSPDTRDSAAGSPQGE